MENDILLMKIFFIRKKSWKWVKYEICRICNDYKSDRKERDFDLKKWEYPEKLFLAQIIGVFLKKLTKNSFFF